MKFTYKKTEDIPATILDRFAVAFLSAVLGFISGLIIWAGLAGLNHGGVSFIVLPFTWVLWFTCIMALLGFFCWRIFWKISTGIFGTAFYSYWVLIQNIGYKNVLRDTGSR